ncbi:MAG: hypothetical protein NT126_04880 [Bacteroidetes bacterium]|nr:hypothetical protein [Bacteroidota bacterium]
MSEVNLWTLPNPLLSAAELVEATDNLVEATDNKVSERYKIKNPGEIPG